MNSLCQAFTILFNPPPYVNIKVDYVNTVLVTGQSGIGKTFVINKLAEFYSIPRISVTLGILSLHFPGNLSKGVEYFFELAKRTKRCVLILENIDLLASRANTDMTLLNSLVNRIKEFQENDLGPLLTATTTDSTKIHPFVRHLFDNSILLEIPSPTERLHIFKYCFSKVLFEISSGVVLELSDRCHGYIASDVEALVRKICQEAIFECDTEEPPRIDQRHINAALSTMRISTLSQSNSIQKVEKVRWDDIGGLDSVKAALQESVIWIYKHREAFARLGITPSKGILLYGPPGTGKTLLAKAVATESDANYLPVSIPDLIKGEVGESEKAIANIFHLAKKSAPCVVFLDELDSLFGSRDSSGDVGKKLITQLLIEIDDIDSDISSSSVVILGATNNPEKLDPAILRAGRLDKHIYIPPPDSTGRSRILELLSENVIFQSVTVQEISCRTKGYTGADLMSLVRAMIVAAYKRTAVINASEEDVHEGETAKLVITEEDVNVALRSVKGSVSKDELKKLENWIAVV
ncbi:P-loop containing nucleoside triphosphate hydrolase protein [Paraphysoderma sedebokerense]|nr:P-loop containing nucleoside triphosphate hydrolase protein [Paraphysoderma sedebokerense]